MRVAIEELEGVREVEVTLADGFARVELAPGNRVTVEQLRRVVRDNGFTPKGARVRVAGRVVESNGELALNVTGLDATWPLRLGVGSEIVMTRLRRQVGERVVLDAELPETRIEGDRPALLVRALVDEDPKGRDPTP